jgi:hypothetical protein
VIRAAVLAGATLLPARIAFQGRSRRLSGMDGRAPGLEIVQDAPFSRPPSRRPASCMRSFIGTASTRAAAQALQICNILTNQFE